MIDFKMMKDDLAAFNIELEKYKTFSSYNLENLLGDMKELIKAIEEAKKIIEHDGTIVKFHEMKREWLSKYFEEPLSNNGEPIKNINPEVCEEQLERLSHETE
jgi:arginyl-tRNA synthetase